MAKYSPYEALARYEKSGFFTMMAATALPAATRISHDAGRQFNGIVLEIITTAASTPTLTPRIEVVDDVGNAIVWWSAAAAITANGTFVYILMQQGGASGANGSGVTEKADVPLPRNWRLFLDRSAGTITAEVHIAYL